VGTKTIAAARSPVLAHTGLLKPELTGLPKRAAGRSLNAHKAAHIVIQR